MSERAGRAVTGPQAPLRLEQRSKVTSGVDGIVDGAAVAFLVWTVFYEVALATGASLWLAVDVWVPVSLVILVLFGARSWRRGPSTSSASTPETGWLSRLSVRRSGLVLAATGWFALAVTVLALRQRSAELNLLLLLAAGCVLLALVASIPTPDHEPGSVAVVRPRDTYVVLLLAVGAAILASLLFHTDADDVYYVNRATWVAEHGTAALRDTMFGPLTYPNTYANGVVPLASIEALQGALGHLLGVSGASMSYLVSVPVVAFLAVWALWRLVRLWAPRRPLLALLVALTFILFSGAGVVGSYSFGRLWQGKVMADVVIIPLIWCTATQVATRRHRADLWFMFVLGGCFVGLTSTAALLGPVMGAALLVCALVVRSGHLAKGALLLTAAPVAAGLVALVSARGGSPTPPLPTWTAFEIAVGSNPWLAALGLFALVVAPLLVRRGAPTVLAAAAALIFIGSMLPGVTDLMSRLTGAGPVLWRFSLAAPLAAMVGLLGTANLKILGGGGEYRPVRLLPAGLVAVLATVGLPIWSPALGSSFTSAPTWKMDPSAKAVAVRVSRLHVGPGPVLLPPTEMQVLAVTTTRMFAVMPRNYYIGSLDEPASMTEARMRLYRLVGHLDPVPDLRGTRSALNALDVSLVCVGHEDRDVIQKVRESGFRHLTSLEHLSCLVPRS